MLDNTSERGMRLISSVGVLSKALGCVHTRRKLSIKLSLKGEEVCLRLRHQPTRVGSKLLKFSPHVEN